MFSFNNLLSRIYIHNHLELKEKNKIVKSFDWPSFKGLNKILIAEYNINTNAITKQRSLKISSKKNNNSRITEKLLYSNFVHRFPPRVTSRHASSYGVFVERKLHGVARYPGGSFPPPVCLSYRVGPVYSIEYLSSFHRVTYQPVLSVRVHECNATS